jgi:hypothetical protein
MPGMKGYTFWTVKDIFDRTYHLYDNFLDRLRVEADELLEKITKLQEFSHTDKFATLPLSQHRLLEDQFLHMTKYHETLVKRIADLS